MTLPWYLNPWAEVRRLQAEIKWRDIWRQSAVTWMKLTHEECTKRRALEVENAELRQQIAEMEERRTDYIRRTAG